MSTERQRSRADARANRDKILDVARQVLAVDPQASLNSIVKAAGIGAGTFYRHFPSREALILGIYRNDIDALVALAPALLTERPPLEAFGTWCERLTEYGRLKHGIAETLHVVMSERDFQETYQAMAGAIRLLVEACERADDLRQGNQAEDILVVLAALWRIPPTPGGAIQAQRLLKLLFRGLGAREADIGHSAHQPSAQLGP